MRRGLLDWRLQRLSAMFISIFAVPVLGLWFSGYLVTDYDWYVLLSSIEGRVLTLIGLIGFAVHSHLGLWVVLTDYCPRDWQTVVMFFIDMWLCTLFGYGLYLLWIL